MTAPRRDSLSTSGPSATDERIISHLGFARAVASRSLDPRCRGADREDLIAWGVFGLVQSSPSGSNHRENSRMWSVGVARERDDAATASGQPQLRTLQERRPSGGREPSTTTAKRGAISEHRIPLKPIPACAQPRWIGRVAVCTDLRQDVSLDDLISDHRPRPAHDAPHIAGPALAPISQTAVTKINFGDDVPEIVARNVVALLHRHERRAVRQWAAALEPK